MLDQQPSFLSHVQQVTSQHSVHEISYALFNTMQLLEKLHPLAVELLKLLLVSLINMLIFPWHTAMHILWPQNRSVIIQAEAPLVGDSINVLDACSSILFQHICASFSVSVKVCQLGLQVALAPIGDRASAPF